MILIGVSSNAMKMMADNFKAFLGKAKLGISCPKMVEAFAKYKMSRKKELEFEEGAFYDKSSSSKSRFLRPLSRRESDDRIVG